MTGQTTGRAKSSDESTGETLDAESAERIDTYLQRALDADGDEKDFHVRQARQLLAAYTE